MKSRRSSSIGVLSVLAFLVASTTSGVSFARDDARLAALKAAELARFAANDSADAKALDELLDADLEYVHSNGDLDTKRTFIDALVSGKRDYISSQPTIENVRILGDFAIIRGHASIKIADNGDARVLDIGYTDVWVWKQGHWRMTAWRSARMPAPAPAAPAPAPAPGK